MKSNNIPAESETTLSTAQQSVSDEMEYLVSPEVLQTLAQSIRHQPNRALDRSTAVHGFGELEHLCGTIRTKCEETIASISHQEREKPRIRLMTLAIFCVVTLVFTLVEFIFIAHNAPTSSVVILGLSELILYALVAISGVNDLYQRRDRASETDIGDRLSFLSNEVQQLGRLRTELGTNVEQLQTLRKDLDRQCAASQESLETKGIEAAEIERSIADLLTRQKQLSQSSDREAEEHDRLSAANLAAGERLKILHSEIDELVRTRSEFEALREQSKNELLKIQTELELNHQHQLEIAVKVGELSQKVELADQRLLEQESELASNLDMLAESRSKVQDQTELEREIEQQKAMLEMLQQSEIELNTRLEDAQARQQLEQLELQRDSTRVEIAEQESKLEQMKTSVTELRDTFELLTREKLIAEQELEQLRSTSEEYRARSVSALASQEELARELRKWEEEIARETCEYEQLEGLLQSKTTQLEMIELDIQKRDKDLQLLQNRCAQVEHKANALATVVQEKTEEILSSKQQLIDIKAELRQTLDVRDELSNAKIALDATRVEGEILSQRAVEAHETFVRMESEIDKLEKRVVDVKASLSDSDKELSSKRDAIRVQECLLEDLKRSLELERNSHESMLIQMAEQSNVLQATVNQLTDQAAEANRTLAQLHQQTLDQEALASEKLRGLDRLIEESEAKLAPKQAEIQQLIATRTALESELRDLDKQLAAKTKSNEVADGTAQRLNEEMINAEHQISELCSERNEIANQLAAKQNVLGQTLSQIEVEKCKLAKLLEHISLRESELDELGSKSEEASRDLEALYTERSRHKALSQENDALEMEISRQQDLLNGLQQDQVQVEQQLLRSKLESQGLQSEVDRLVGKLDELRNSVSSHSSILAEEKQLLIQVFEQQQQEQLKLAEISKDLSRARSKTESQKVEYQNLLALQKQAEDQRKVLAKEITEAQTIGAEWETYVHRLQAEVQRKQQDKLTLENQIQAQNQRKREAMDELQKIESNLQNAQHELNLLRDKIQYAKDDLVTLNHENRHVQQDRVRLERELSDAQEQLSQKKIEFDRVQKDLQLQKDNVAIESQLLADLQRSRKLLEADLASLTQDREQCRSEYESLVEQNQTIARQLEVADEKLSELASQVGKSEQLKIEIRNLSSQKTEFEHQANDLANKIEEASDLIGRLESDVRAQEQASSRLQEENAVASERLARFVHMISEKQAENNLLVQTQAELQRENAHAVESLSQIKNEQQNAQAKLADSTQALVALLAELNKVENQQAEVLNAKIQACAQLNSTIREFDRLTAELDNLRRKKVEADSANELSERKLNEQILQLGQVENANYALQTQKEALQAELETLESQRSDIQRKLDSLKDSFSYGLQQEEELRKLFGRLDEQKQSLEGDLHHNRNTLQELAAQIESESLLLMRLRTDRADFLAISEIHKLPEPKASASDQPSSGVQQTSSPTGRQQKENDIWLEMLGDVQLSQREVSKVLRSPESRSSSNSSI